MSAVIGIRLENKIIELIRALSAQKNQKISEYVSNLIIDEAAKQYGDNQDIKEYQRMQQKKVLRQEWKKDNHDYYWGKNTFKRILDHVHKDVLMRKDINMRLVQRLVLDSLKIYDTFSDNTKELLKEDKQFIINLMFKETIMQYVNNQVLLMADNVGDRHMLKGVNNV